MNRQTLIVYALPAMPLAALTLPLYVLVPTFYSETLGLSLAAVGLALLVVRAFDALTDPIIGWASDRVRPVMGRRRFLFAISLPVSALAAVMLFWPPTDAGALWLTGWGCLLSLGFTAATLSYQAWGAELAGDYHGRARIAGYRETFTIIGTLAAITIPFGVGMEQAQGLHGLAVLGLSVGFSLMILGTLAVLRVPEPREYSSTRLGFRDGLRHMAHNAPFLRLLIAYFLNGLANGIPATLFLYFVSSVLAVPDMRGPLLFLYFLAGLAGVPLAVVLSRQWGKHGAWCWAMLANCVIFASVPLLGAGDTIPFAVVCVATGICLGFDLALPAAIQADVIDADTAVSGEQRSGLYFAAWSLATKLSLAAGVGIVFPVLQLAGFDPAPGAVNAPSALSALVAVYVGLPLVLKALAIALMWRFPIGQEQQEELRRSIEGRG